MYLSIADFCLSVICFGLCFYNYSNGHLMIDSIACKIQPTITWYFMEASMLWLASIAVHSFRVVSDGKPISLPAEVLANVVCWGVPIITVFVPLSASSGESYGPRNGLWCSFSENMKAAQLGNLMAYYVPCLILISLCYIGISYKIRNLGKIENNDRAKRKTVSTVRKLFLFVLSYFVVWTPLVLCYIWERATGQYVGFWIEFFSDNLIHCQGIFNVVLYGINENLLESIKQKHCGFLRSSEIDLDILEYTMDSSPSPTPPARSSSSSSGVQSSTGGQSAWAIAFI